MEGEVEGGAIPKHEEEDGMHANELEGQQAKELEGEKKESECCSKYDKLILLDFEMTSEGLEPPSKTEIVEMSWILWDTVSRSAPEEDKFQVVIKPADASLIDDAFVARTNMPPATFESGCSLSDAVRRFDTFVFEKLILPQKTFCLVTVGPEKLKDYFRTEAEKKELKLQPHFLPYFDLLQEFAKIDKSEGDVPGLLGVARALDVPLEASNRRSGFDLCVIMEQAVAQMAAKGHKFDKPLTIDGAYEPNKDAAPGPLPTHPAFAALVRVRGLPWQAGENELKEFFKDYKLCEHETVTLIRMANGMSAGEAFVRFVDEAEADRALSKHKDYIGTRWVEVLKAVPGDVVKAKETHSVPAARGEFQSGGVYNTRPDRDNRKGVARMRGIPWNTPIKDIAAFYDGFGVTEKDIFLVRGVDGKLGSEAFVTFDIPATAERASRELHKKNIGSRYIEIFGSNHTELAEALAVRDGRARPSELGPMMRGGPGGYMDLGGPGFLPRGGRDFGGPGMPRGGGGGFGGGFGRDRGGPPFRDREDRFGSGVGGMGGGGGGGSLYSRDRRPEFSSGFDRDRGAARGGRGGMYMNGGGPAGPMPMKREGAYGRERSREREMMRDREQMMRGAGDRGGERYGGGGSGGARDTRDFGGRGMNGGGSFGGGGRYGDERGYGGGGSGYASRGSDYDRYGGGGRGGGARVDPLMTVLKMRGLPYQANHNHIVDFFNGFHMLAVLPSTAPGGHPNGEAMVEFASADEAARAFDKCNKATIDGRWIDLIPCTRRDLDLAIDKTGAGAGSSGGHGGRSGRAAY